MSKLISTLVIVLCVIGICSAFFVGFSPAQASAEISNIPIRDYLGRFNVIGDIARDYVQNVRDTLGELSVFYEHYQYWEFDEDDEAFRQTLKDLGLMDAPVELDESSGAVQFLVAFLSIVCRMWSFFIQLIVLIAWGARIIVSLIMILVHSIGFIVETVSVFFNLVLGVFFGEYLL